MDTCKNIFADRQTFVWSGRLIWIFDFDWRLIKTGIQNYLQKLQKLCWMHCFLLLLSFFSVFLLELIPFCLIFWNYINFFLELSFHEPKAEMFFLDLNLNFLLFYEAQYQIFTFREHFMCTDLASDFGEFGTSWAGILVSCLVSWYVGNIVQIC